MGMKGVALRCCICLILAARGESTIGRVPSAAGADARRCDAVDAGTSSRSANAADAPAPPEPFGRIGIAGNLCVARRQRCPRIASSSRLDLAPNTYARDLLYFHHGLLANGVFRGAAQSDAGLAAYADLIRSSLASGQIDSFMKLLSRNVTLKDGSNYDSIRKDFQSIIDVTRAEVTTITQVKRDLSRITITITLKSSRAVDLYFDVSGKSGHFRIVDIYNQNGLESRGAIEALKLYKDYNKTPDRGFPGFSYMTSSDSDLRTLKASFKLDQVAGSGDEISRIIKLMQWVHRLAPHDNSPSYIIPSNSLNIIEVCQKEKRGVNCRQLATILNDVYLAMGFKSRLVTCLPVKNEAEDCHVTNLVFSETLKKWIYMDPTFEAYFTNRKGIFLNHSEIRKAIIDGTAIRVNDGINHNGQPYQGGKIGYIGYMAKNMIRFVCSMKSEFGSEQKMPLYVELYPKGFTSCAEFESKTVGPNFQCISDPAVFWANPGN
jgi:hypothetical protein